MPHGLDHIVHAVRDLDAAADFYAAPALTSARVTDMPGARTTTSCS